MIDDQAIRERAATLSIPELQVRRDHVLSHLIHALETADNVVFIGGTALNRTFLPDVRLSEDLDLHLLHGDPETVLNDLLRGVRLEFPGLSRSTVQSSGDVRTFFLEDGSIRVAVQMIRRRQAWADLPAAPAPVRLYYADLPDSVDLVVPDKPSFVAMKLSAYVDWYSARDLFDLSQLAEIDALDKEGVDFAQSLLGRGLQKEEFSRAPSDEQWDTELQHQVADPGRPAEALQVVRERLSDLVGW